MNPPIITTTAATPQDSPITTLAHGSSFSEWENNYCLKPPSVVGSVKGLNNLLLPEPFPIKRKPENASARNVNTTIELEPKASISNIKMDTRKDSTSNETRSDTGDHTNSKSNTKQSLKKRSSTKRKEKQNVVDNILNNERSDSMGHDPITNNKTTAKRIQNNTKNTNKVSPHGRDVFEMTADLNAYATNQPKHCNQYLEHQQSMAAYQSRSRGSIAYRRRMSQLDPQGFKRLDHLDLKQLEALRARAMERDGQLKATVEKDVKIDVPVVNSFMREPIKFTTIALKKRFENFTEGRETYSLYIFDENNKFRQMCDWFVEQKWFDNVILLFIALNCITLAMERPNIPPNCPERYFLATANYIFTFVFTLEMFVKVS